MKFSLFFHSLFCCGILSSIMDVFRTILIGCKTDFLNAA